MYELNAKYKQCLQCCVPVPGIDENNSALFEF